MKQRQQLLIFGTGSQARYVIDNVRFLQHIEIAGLIDLESEANIGRSINGIKVRGVLQRFDVRKFPPDQYFAIVAFGNNKKKQDICLWLKEKGYQFLSVVHPTVYLAQGVTVGEGCIINPNVTILPNACIGNHVVIHSGAVIEHDCVLQDWVNIAPGVSFGGRVTVGEGSYVYTGSTVAPKVRIGKWAIIGAGSVVLRDVPDYTTVVGVPARVLRCEYPGDKK